MDMVGQLVKNICVFMILTTVINNLLQDSVYRRYIRFFVGIVVVILVINPILSLLSLDMDFAADIEKYMADAKLDEVYDDISDDNLVIYDDVIEEYETSLDDTMNNIADKHGLYVADSSWDIENNPHDEFGKILEVNVSFAYKDEIGYVMEEDLCEEIAYEFETERENIHIEII